MHCPSCRAGDTRVIDSRVIEEGSAIRRRRNCETCSFRFSTLEEMEILSLTVDKADGSEEPYDKDKLLFSLNTPLRKRPITSARLKSVVNSIQEEIQTKAKADHIASSIIGEIVMKHLKKLDKVAYIRFASVYRSFEDLSEFTEEVNKISPKKKSKKKKK